MAEVTNISSRINLAKSGRGRWYSWGSIRRLVKELRRYPVVPIVVLLLVLIIPAIFADVIAPHDPIKADLAHRLEPPAWVGHSILSKTVVEQGQVRDSKNEMSITSARQLRPGAGIGQSPNVSENLKVGDEIQVVTSPGGSWSRPLGTDTLGRDILSRMIHGARVSSIVSLIVIAISGVIGTSLGLIAAFYGGWVDYTISRVIDIFLSMPPLLIALVLVFTIGPSLSIVVAVIVIQLWSVYARLVRGETLSLMGQDYIARARVAGASNPRIIMRHLFPNVVTSLIVLATLQVGFVIIFEAALSFLGAGIPRPTPSWGVIVADGRDLIIASGWWVSIFSGLAIVLTVLSVNLIGDWTRDRLDPKLRHI